MPLTPDEIADALSSLREFAGVASQAALIRFLDQSDCDLEYRYVDPIPEPSFKAGSPFRGLILIRQGEFIAWTNPPSYLGSPFLIGQHEFISSDRDRRWLASYSASAASGYLEIPVPLMDDLVEEFPRLLRNFQSTVSRVLTRFYWTSLAGTGSPESKVAAALMSRLVLEGIDTGTNRVIGTDQTVLVRLTRTSRTGVYHGLKSLSEKGLIKVVNPTRDRPYITGKLRIPSVDRLRQTAESSFREKIVKPRIARHDMRVGGTNPDLIR